MENIENKKMRQICSYGDESVVKTLLEHIAKRDLRLRFLEEDWNRLSQQMVEKEQALQELRAAIATEQSRLAQQLIERSALIDSLNQGIAERDGQNVALVASMKENEGRIWSLEELVREKDCKIITLSQTVVELDGQIAGLNQTVAERDGRISSLNQGIAERDIQIAALYNSRSWRFAKPLRAIGTKFRQMIARVAIIKTIGGFTRANGLRAGYRLFKGRRLLLRSGVFDANYYLRQNPDVTAARIDPALHFMIHGVREGRDPNAFFDTNWYLRQNPDVAEAGLNPLIHYIQFGADEGRDPSSRFSGSAYLAANPDVAAAGTNPLLHYLKFGMTEGRLLRALSAVGQTMQIVTERNGHVSEKLVHRNGEKHPSSQRLLQHRFQQLRPLSVFTVPKLKDRRINLITDSVNSGSLFGGVATAIILATQLAEMRQARLRIITRTERAQESNVAHILNQNGLSISREIEFLFAPGTDNSVEVDIDDGEFFLTTSWWTTCSTMASVRNERILYLLQEDERMFYPYGDDRLRCEQTMRDQGIRFAVNTRLLFEHLLADGFDNLRERGTWFEPAFPKEVFYPERKPSSGKRKFLFYARPNNLRNLFYLGVDVIEEAILRGVIDLCQWDVVFVGKDVPALSLVGGYTPRILENLSWAEYAALVRSVDLGLCLMYSPHPSYPPLDLVASGAVAVTNRYGWKQDLSAYSRNLICAELDRESLVQGIETGVRLAVDPNTREANFRCSSFCYDWRHAFSEVVRQHAEEVT